MKKKLIRDKIIHDLEGAILLSRERISLITSTIARGHENDEPIEKLNNALLLSEQSVQSLEHAISIVNKAFREEHS